MIYMSGTKFIFKEKTEKYKEQVFQTEHGQSNEITTEETIVLLNCDNEICVSFTFIPISDLKWDAKRPFKIRNRYRT